MPDLNREALNELAALCRIDCSESELETLLTNLQSVLRYMEELKEVETESTLPCTYVAEEMEPYMREDEVSDTLDRSAFLENSPSHVGGMVRVPTVIKF